MEILPLSNVSLKIKGKKASLVVDPQVIREKVEADGIVILTQEDFAAAKIEGARVVLRGPGEYEVSGIKISGVKVGGHLVYKLHVDGINIALTTGSATEGLKDQLSDHHILILYADAAIDSSIVATLEPRVVLFYGQQAKDFVKDGVSTAKFFITKEKLPEKMETVILQ
ncbi:MAG: hypothetical protein HYV39_04400 [Candidatus Levybacteria bacterium]|nr:hypothetical protein [Candidatus Levybacteria bacterium]